MIVKKMDEFKGGWFIGNFEPSIFKTSEFEVAIMQHKKGEEWPCHYHTGTEINYLIKGSMKMHDVVLNTGDVFLLDKFEVADPIFLEDCVLVVVKTPSKPGDKFNAERPQYGK